MSTRHILKIFRIVNVSQYCFFRKFGETSSHTAENLGTDASPGGCLQGFHRQSFKGEVKSDFSTHPRSRAHPRRRHIELWRVPPIFHSELNQPHCHLKITKTSQLHHHNMSSESTQTQTQEIRQTPSLNSPAWIRIPATQVARAQKFYEEVFGWKFMEIQGGYAPDKLAVFTIPGAPTLMVRNLTLATSSNF
jgi:hypothetical protein